ncbi:MAG: SurA N-terminal domain-containing protein [Akkermansiaceae bacterium]
MKSTLPILACGFSAFFTLSCPGQEEPPPPPADPPAVPPAENGQIRPKTGPIRVNGIAAKANGEIITMNELMIKVAPLQSVLMARYPRRGPAYQAQLKTLRGEVLDDLIDRAIIYAEFKERARPFTDRDLEDEVQRIVQVSYAGDEKLFRDYLKATNLTRDQFKQQQRKEILVQAVRSQHFGDVPPPTEAELRKEYSTWSVANRDRTKDVATYKRIYLPKAEGGGPLAQLKLAEDLGKKLKDGGDFAVAAKTYSRDSHAENGGLWEDVPRSDLNHEFGFILFESEGNDVIGPFEDPYGFNIIQVVKRDYGPAEPFAKVRDRMKKRVEAEKKNANFEEWMKKMRARADIKKMID